jgi:hypothetical protein
MPLVSHFASYFALSGLVSNKPTIRQELQKEDLYMKNEEVISWLVPWG